TRAERQRPFSDDETDGFVGGSGAVVGGHLSDHAVQSGVPRLVPFADRVHLLAHAVGRRRRVRYGRPPRRRLRRLLLGADAAALRRRGHEPVDDYRLDDLRPRGEAVAFWRTHRAYYRGRPCINCGLDFGVIVATRLSRSELMHTSTNSGRVWTLSLLAAGIVMLTVSPASAQRWGRERFPDSGACFFRDAEFRGDYFCIRAGDDVGRMPPEMNDGISSIRVFGRAEVVVFRDVRFNGGSTRFDRSIDNLRDAGWNDRISSIQVRIGGDRRDRFGD